MIEDTTSREYQNFATRTVIAQAQVRMCHAGILSAPSDVMNDVRRRIKAIQRGERDQAVDAVMPAKFGQQTDWGEPKKWEVTLAVTSQGDWALRSVEDLAWALKEGYCTARIVSAATSQLAAPPEFEAPPDEYKLSRRPRAHAAPGAG